MTDFDRPENDSPDDTDPAYGGSTQTGSFRSPRTSPMSDGSAPADAVAADDSGIPPHYGIGPFSIREVALGIVWVIAFIVSFFPWEFTERSVWTSGLEWILTIGVPTAAVFLIALRRLSPSGITRVGSLGIDQFASVAFSVSAVLWIQYVWQTVAFAMTSDRWVRTWVMWVEAVLMLVAVVLTVAARWLPVLGDDFRYRPEVAAQPSARPLRPVVARPATPRAPRAPKPAKAPKAERVEQVSSIDELVPTASATSDESAAWSSGDTAAVAEPATTAMPVESAPAEEHPPASQAFWALVPVERDVVDEHGVPLFRIGPTAWALVIEDRGSVFVVRNDDGRVGYLHDVSGVTRG